MTGDLMACPEVTAEVLPPNRVPQVHCRGRWRAVKRKLQVLAVELGWPGCVGPVRA